MKYYTEEEITGALQRATRTINLLTESCTGYTRGINDCFALLAEYDKELRGESKARDLIKFKWKSSREFEVKLAHEGYSIASYMEYCDYKLINDKRPLIGDIAFEDGAMISGDGFWVSTNENNTGVYNTRQVQFLERKLHVLARPIRS